MPVKRSPSVTFAPGFLYKTIEIPPALPYIFRKATRNDELCSATWAENKCV